MLRLLEQGHPKKSLECALNERCYAELRAQVPLYYLCGGQAYADCYLRFEHLQEDFAALCRRLRLPQLTLPWIQRGHPKPGRRLIDATIRIGRSSKSAANACG